MFKVQRLLQSKFVNTLEHTIQRKRKNNGRKLKQDVTQKKIE